MAGSVKIYPRTDAQSRAADPHRNIWVEASAGTGKTQVLTDRILRLLLAGAPPERILALTFTKAAAAEMQNRLTRTLARWRQAGDAELCAELKVLGAGERSEVVARARRLFAEVLDLPAGLALQTLHSFAQSLLAGFPLEAGLAPGFAALDERDARQLKARTLSEAIAEAQTRSQGWFLEDLGALALIGGQDGLDKLIEKLLRASEAFAAYRSPDAIAAMVSRKFNVPEGAEPEDMLRRGLSREGFDDGAAEEIAALFQQWASAKAGAENAASLRQWLDFDDTERAEQYEVLRSVFLTQDDKVRSFKNFYKKVPEAEGPVEAMAIQLQELEAQVRAVRSARLNTRALRVGHLLSDRYRALKHAEGVIDYDDMINITVRLLGTAGVPDWIKYKLDQRFDHILVDEAQDTNRQQWAVIGHLVDDYFSEEDRQRTLFVVGDFKQAIYRFQGTDPAIFAAEGKRLGELARRAGRGIEHVPLDRSFRSGPAVLEFVNGFLKDAGPEALGLASPPESHVPNRADAGGEVVLWPLVTTDTADDDEDSEEAGEGTSDEAEARLAAAIAAQVAGWLSPGAERLWLPAHQRFVRPEDILILLRRRSSLMLRLVEEMHRHKVAVAGVDRLVLTEPLAALDLIALVRFATQPDDDLNLANLLVSPFIGWADHEKIRLLSQGRGQRSLWRQLAGAETQEAKTARKFLTEVLNLADRSTPYQFLDQILSGPMGGRRLLTARLGSESGQVIDEMLNQALAFEENHPPLLAGFLYWLTADKFEIKREPDPARGEVRLMTIHGSKGLEAPVVIVGDSGIKQQAGRSNLVELEVEGAGVFPFMHEGLKKSVEPLLGALTENNVADEQENLRLLYVALTRAADHLFIGGSISQKEAQKLDPETCERWHSRLWRVLSTFDDAEEVPAGHFGGPALRIRRGNWQARGDDGATLHPDSVVQQDLGGLVLDKAPEVGPLDRPLRPSKMPEGPVEGPALDDRKAAAERGLLMHKLFEKLPEMVAAADVRKAAIRWLAGRNIHHGEAEAMVDEVLTVMATHPAIFAPGSLAEAPIMGEVGHHVVTGVVDRLVVTDDKVLVVDFKTGLFVPDGVAQVPDGHLQQMALYVAVLEAVFPERLVEAALLYTAGPKLILLGAKQLHALRTVDPTAVMPN